MIQLEPFTSDDFTQLMEWVDDERLMKEWSGSMFLWLSHLLPAPL